VPLKPGDVLTVHQMTGWDDIGASITMGRGRSSLATTASNRASGSAPFFAAPGDSAPRAIRQRGAAPRRVRKLEEKSREELIRQIENKFDGCSINPSLGSTDQSATVTTESRNNSER